MTNILKEIPGYPNYLAGNDGLIYTVVKHAGARFGGVPTKMRQRIIRGGYLVTQVRRDGKNKNALTHVLIAAAFYGSKNGLDVNHIDGDKTNNKPCNLEYLTRSENIKHAVRLGLWNAPKGSKAHRAKFIESDIPGIRKELEKALADGKSICSVAAKYGVVPNCMYAIRKRKTWKHVA